METTATPDERPTWDAALAALLARNDLPRDRAVEALRAALPHARSDRPRLWIVRRILVLEGGLPK
ncbi:MAG: hypothetical protein ACC662_10020 [Planctomycetota bacterium]